MTDNRPIDSVSADSAASNPPAHGQGAARVLQPSSDTPAELTSSSRNPFTDALRVLYKRRLTAMTGFVVVAVVGVLYVFSLTPLFEARVQLLIEVEQPNVLSFREVVDQNRATLDYFQTQYRILQSRTLARKTIEALHLWNDPRLVPRKTQTSRWQAVAGLLGMTVGPTDAHNPETVEQARALDAFQSQLTVTPVRNSRLMELMFRSSDPTLAAQAVNGLAQAYMQQNLEFRFSASKEATDWLSGQLAEQRKRVEADELALQQYRERNDAVSLEDRQNIVVQKLVDLNAALTKAKTDRIQKEAVYNQVRTLQLNSGSIDTFPAIMSNGFVQQLKSELSDLQRQQAQLAASGVGPKHPDVVRIRTAIQSTQLKLQAETDKVLQSLRNDYLAAQAQEQSLSDAVEQQKRDALELNRKGIDYSVLQRDAAANRQLFEGLLQRTRESGISGELRTSNVRVVDQAEVPRSPAFPNKTTDLAAVLTTSSVFGIALAFFFEYLDSHIKSPDELQQYLDVPYLGLLPDVSLSNGDDPLLGGETAPPGAFAESIRALRTNVMFSFADDQKNSIVVTSTGPSEGKTIVAGNVAAALALSEKRVLLIDADLRKPRVHTLFGLEQGPGLADMLVGVKRASEVVHAARVPGLWVLSAGTTSPNPAELLGSDRFRRFLDTLAEHFDWVIVDAPPVLPVTDAALIGHLTGGVLFVVGTDMTNRQAAQNAVRQLRAGRARIVGAMLNRVPLKRHSYYYSHYYRPSYGDYYVGAAAK